VTESQETSESTMAQIDVEELGPCKRKLTVHVPQETISREVSKSFDEITARAAVPGFRRGRAPRRLLEARLGDAVHDDVKESLIGRSYEEALEQNDFEPVGTPDVQNIEFDPEGGLSYEVTLEIKPVFEVEGYDELVLVRPSTEPNDEDIEQALERLRDREGHFETVEGASFDDDRLAIVDCTVTIDGETFVEREQAELVGGRRNWLRLFSEEVDEPLKGKSTGDEVSFSTVVRPDFQDESKQGKVAEVTVKFYEIKEFQRPEADDELAKSLGAEDLDDLKGRIREQLARVKEADAQAALRQQLEEKLLEKFDFAMPEELLREHADDILRRQRLELQYRGLPLEEVDQHIEELTDASQKRAEQQFKLHFILEKIAEKERIFATEGDLENEIALLASEYGVRPARMRAELDHRRMVGELRLRIRERKTIDAVLAKAKVEEAKAGEEAETHTETEGDEPQE